MHNLLNSTEIATIFVDNDLNIKRFTPQATNMAHLIATDIGRPLEHIATNIEYPELIADIREVNKSLERVVKEIKTKQGDWFQVRILPYRTVDNQIDGAVITFASIDLQKKAQQQLTTLNEELEYARQYAENIIDTVREALIILDAELHVVKANRSFYRMFRSEPKKTLHKNLFSLGNQQWKIPQLLELLKKTATVDAVFENYAVTHVFPHIGARTMVLNARRLYGAAETDHRILLAIEDITDKQKDAEGVIDD
jgi:two-component system CheB/CheR fusion protein